MLADISPLINKDICLTKTCWNLKNKPTNPNPHLYTWLFPENYQTRGTPQWKATHRKQDHAVANIQCEPGPPQLKAEGDEACLPDRTERRRG